MTVMSILLPLWWKYSTTKRYNRSSWIHWNIYDSSEPLL